MSDVYDESTGRWVPESAPFVPAVGEPCTPVADLLSTDEERRQGGFYVGRPDYLDDAFTSRTRRNEDRSAEAVEEELIKLIPLVLGALTAFENAATAPERADCAEALALRVDALMRTMGVRL